MLQAGVDGVGPDQLQHGERPLQGEVHRLAGQDTRHRWVVLYQCCGSGIRCLFDPWIRDEQPESYFRELRNHYFGLTYLNYLMRIRDGKNSDPG
jgi:hypothetical protein